MIKLTSVESIMVYQFNQYNYGKILGCMFHFLYFPVAVTFNLFELSMKYFIYVGRAAGKKLKLIK